MKTLLTILLLTSVYAKGQTTTIISHGTMGSGDSVYRYKKYDTVLSILLVSDTSYYSKNGMWTIGNRIPVHDLTWIIKGYEVYENKPTYDSYECGSFDWCIGWRDHPEFIGYLDEYKHAISYLVWQSKQIK